jgi:uncharacterized protein
MARKSSSPAFLANAQASCELAAYERRLTMSTPCTWDGDTLVLNILGTPAAKRDAIGKIKGHQLKVSVTAPPEDGRATDHMVKFLARAFGVASKDITVVFGRTSVNKQLRIRSPSTIPEALLEVLGDGKPLPKQQADPTNR